MDGETSKARSPRHPLSAWLSGSRVVAAVLLGGAALRVAVWACKHFWWDSYALLQSFTCKTFVQLLTGPLDRGQSAPVGFTLAMKLWGSVFGYSEKSLTFPLLAIGIVSLVLLDRCLSAAGIRRMRIPALLAFAIHPGLVFYSAEFKPYGIDVLVATLFVLVLLRSDRTIRLGRIALLCFLSPFFSTAAIFQIPFFLLFLFLSRFTECGTVSFWVQFRRSAVPMLLPGLVACLGIGLAAWHLVSTMPDEHMNAHWSHMNAFAPLPFAKDWIGWHLEKIALFFRGPVYFSPIPRERGIVQLFSAAVPVCFLVLGSLPRKNGSVRRVLLFGVAVSLGVFLASALRKWPIDTGDFISGRLVLFLVPAFSVALAAGADWLSSRLSWMCAMVAAAMFFSAGHPLVRWLATDRWMVQSYDGGKSVRLVVSRWVPGTKVWVDPTSGSPFGSVEPVFFKTARKDFRWFQPWNEQPAVWPTPAKGTLALFNCNYGYGRNALEKTKRKAEEAGLRCTATTNRPMVLVEFD